VTRRVSLLLAAAGLALVAAALAGLKLGAVDLPWTALPGLLTAGDGGVEAVIVRDLRLPRVLLAMLVGAGLAGAGAAYQALFRNPLAEPFVIGASSGAALGATTLLVTGVAVALVPLAAFGGALAAVVLVYLLAGAAVTTVLDAAVSLVMIVEDQSLHAVFGWLLGGFASARWDQLAWGAPMILAGIAWIWLLARPLDALSLGDETARSLGLSPLQGRVSVVAAASLATAAAVSVAGIIGFVGLMAPHAARLLFGARHRLLVPASCLLGALLVVAADLAARTVAVPREVPVGVVTALVGGPFFLYLLRSRSVLGAAR
jgi:iron complex transport system permease protein